MNTNTSTTATPSQSAAVNRPTLKLKISRAASPVPATRLPCMAMVY